MASNMQIHLALAEAPRWPSSALNGVAYLHLSGGTDAVSRAVNEAERGLLPAEPTICIAQPTALDPSRAPEGKHILWFQLPECPRAPVGDAARELAVSPDAQWTPALRDAYASRVIDRIARQVPNLRSSILGSRVLSPADLEALNMNRWEATRMGATAASTSLFCGALRRRRATTRRSCRICGTSAPPRIPDLALPGGSGLHLARSLGAA
jgi:phytoene dehydrogenase-like protein